MIGLVVLLLLAACIVMLVVYIITKRNWISFLCSSWKSLGKTSKSLQPQSSEREPSEVDVLQSLGYEVGERIGEGTYAEVKRAFSRNIKKEVAIKIVTKEKDIKGNSDKFLKREIEILRWLNHKNVVRVYDLIDSSHHFFIVMELATKGDLLTLLQKRSRLKEDDARSMFRSIARGVLHCHKKGVTHRDLKLENILLSEDNCPIVTDFGFARFVGSAQEQRTRSRTFCGSYAYVAPEILQGIPYDGMASDVWSLGVVLYTMVCGRFPFDDSDPKVLLQQTTSGSLEYPATAYTLSPQIKDLISKMLSTDVNRRITLTDALQHPWTTRLRKASSTAVKQQS